MLCSKPWCVPGTVLQEWGCLAHIWGVCALVEHSYLVSSLWRSLAAAQTKGILLFTELGVGRLEIALVCMQDEVSFSTANVAGQPTQPCLLLMGGTDLLPLVTRNFIHWISSPAALCWGLVCILTNGYLGSQCCSVLAWPCYTGTAPGWRESDFYLHVPCYCQPGVLLLLHCLLAWSS